MTDQPKPKKPTGRPKKPMAWEDALALLPPNATVEEEMNWIAAHPAMYAKTREPDEKKRNAHIILTGNDILNAVHGRAPSRAAASLLQYWCNNYDMYYKQILMEQKKKSQKPTGVNGRPASADEDVRDIESYLKELGEL